MATSAFNTSAKDLGFKQCQSNLLEALHAADEQGVISSASLICERAKYLICMVRHNYRNPLALNRITLFIYTMSL